MRDPACTAFSEWASAAVTTLQVTEQLKQKPEGGKPHLLVFIQSGIPIFHL